MTAGKRALLRIFGKNVRRERLKRGVSQEKLGFACGLHRNYIGYVERGECSITVASIIKLAKGLRTTANRLFQGLI